MPLSPDYRYDSKACYTESTVGDKLDPKKHAEQGKANTACNGYNFTNSSLISQKPAALIAHQ
jgi:hypothetical protein